MSISPHRLCEMDTKARRLLIERHGVLAWTMASHVIELVHEVRSHREDIAALEDRISEMSHA